MDLLGGFAVDDARRDFHAFDLAGNDINALMIGTADPPLYNENDHPHSSGYVWRKAWSNGVRFGAMARGVEQMARGVEVI